MCLHCCLVGQASVIDASLRVCLRGVAVSFDHDGQDMQAYAVGKLLSRYHPSGKRGLRWGIAVGRWSMRRLQRFLLYSSVL